MRDSERLYDIQLRLHRLSKRVKKIEKSLNTVLYLIATGLFSLIVFYGVEIYGILL